MMNYLDVHKIDDTNYFSYGFWVIPKDGRLALYDYDGRMVHLMHDIQVVDNQNDFSPSAVVKMAINIAGTEGEMLEKIGLLRECKTPYQDIKTPRNGTD
jgi:hypothetical protein